MGFYRGPNIVTNGLKLYYDVANCRCFMGEPTINKANSDLLRTITPYMGSMTVSDAPEKGIGWKKITINSITSNYRIAKFPYIVQSGETVTYSLEYDFNGCVGYYWGLDGTIGTETGNYLYNDGNIFALTYTNSVSQNLSIFLNNKNRINTSGFTDVIYYRNYQVENKSYRTPFTENERGLTYESGGGLVDLSRNNNNSYFYGNVVFNNTYKTLTFNGGSIQTPHNYNITEYTFSCWIKATNNTPIESYGRAIFSTSTSADVGNLSSIFLNNKNIRVYSFSWYDSTYYQTSTNEIELNQWYNVAVSSIKGGSLNIYLNGVLIGQSISNNMNSSSTSFTIGDIRAGRNINFLGDIGHPMFYNRFLNSDEIYQIYNSTKYRYK